jgi:hypothetical protein
MIKLSLPFVVLSTLAIIFSPQTSLKAQTKIRLNRSHTGDLRSPTVNIGIGVSIQIE